MLMPRFTIRTALISVALCAPMFLIMGFAFRGENFAWVVTIGLVSLAVTALVHAAWFAVVWLFTQLPTDEPAPPARLATVAGPANPLSGEGGNIDFEHRGEANG